MPTNKTMSGSKNTKGYRKGYYKKKSISNRLRKIEQKVKQEEVKFHANVQTAQPVGTSAAVYPLTNIVEGDAFNEREGNKCLASSLLFRLAAIQSTPATETFLRCIILIDKDNNGVAPVASDILEQNANYLSPLSHVNGKRFKVLMDRMLLMTVGEGGADLKYFTKLTHSVRYDGALATDVREGTMYLLLCSNQGTDFPLIDFYSRFRFTDC